MEAKEVVNAKTAAKTQRQDDVKAGSEKVGAYTLSA
jgi:hypothetical protein